MKRAVVMFSGGAGSWAAAHRAVERFGAENVTLLFGDTRMEDEDLYRFLDEASADVGAELVKLADGRTPWEVFDSVRFLGNSRIDPCSRILKRELLRKWLEDNRSPSDTAVVLGIDWTEIHRYERAIPYWDPWTVLAPLCDEPLIDKPDVLASMIERGVDPPRLYSMGFPHNNCGGFCVKAGQAQFELLLRTMPERYAYHENQERLLGERLGTPVSVMVDRRNLAPGEKRRPLTMRAFRERLVAEGKFDASDWGGCGCFLDS